MSITVHIHPGQFSAHQYTPGCAVVETTPPGIDVAIFLQSPAMCDDLIKAAVAAKSMLLAGTSEPVLPPEGDCEEPHPDTGEPCTRGPRHAGGHVDVNGRYWPRHDGGSEDLDAALTPPGYSLPAGELASEDAR